MSVVLTASGEPITCCDAMLLKFTTLCLVALALFGCLCDAQLSYKTLKPTSQRPYEPKKTSDPQQSKQTFERPISWKFPLDPVDPAKPDIVFEQRFPVAATTVAVECREKDARVEVQKDLFGTGQLIIPADLLLGDCLAAAEDPVSQVLIFESPLHECGSMSMVSKKTLFLKIRSIQVMVKWCTLQMFHLLLPPPFTRRWKTPSFTVLFWTTILHHWAPPLSWGPTKLLLLWNATMQGMSIHKKCGINK